MTDYELMDKLGRALAYGETDQLAAYLAPECDYASEYADLRLDTPEKILEHLKNVYSYSVDECRYTYEVVPLDDVTRGISHLDLNTIEGMRADEYGMLLYRYSDRYPIAVAAAMVTEDSAVFFCRAINPGLTLISIWRSLMKIRPMTCLTPSNL